MTRAVHRPTRHRTAPGWTALPAALGVAMLACGGSQTPGSQTGGPRQESGGTQVGTVSPSRAGANKPAEHSPRYEPIYFTRGAGDQDAVAAAAAGHEDTLPAAMEHFDAPVCDGIPVRSRRSCPLLATVAAIEPVENGFDVRFRPWVAVDRAVELMRCHRAYGETHGSHPMPFCPLYLPGLEIRVLDESTVRFTVDDDESLQELERRLRAHKRAGAAAGASD